MGNPVMFRGMIFTPSRYTFEAAFTSESSELATQDVSLEPPELEMWMSVAVRDLGRMRFVYAGDVDCVQGMVVQLLFVPLPQSMFTQVDMLVRKTVSLSSRQGEVWLRM